jgi:hypothetical protein
MTPPATPRPRIISPVMAGALTGVLVVVISGDVWSFREQTDLAHDLAFDIPWLLPVVLDGLAASLAAVAFAASLDGRPALGARLGTALAVTASAASNLSAAALRLGTESPRDRIALAIAAGIPVAANLAWEVILGELRRQVMRRRGLPAPVPVPWPRVVRVVLAPVSTLRSWRRVVLGLTDPAGGHVNPAGGHVTGDPVTRGRGVSDPVTPRVVTRDPVTPRVSDPRDPSDPVTRDPGDPRGHDRVTPPDPVTPGGQDPVTPVTPDRDPVTPRVSDLPDPVTPGVVTPMTRLTADIDAWVTQALSTGVTRSQVIRAAMTGDPLDGAGPAPRTVSESTIKRALRRATTRQEHTA